jgi:hypothetical protein
MYCLIFLDACMSNIQTIENPLTVFQFSLLRQISRYDRLTRQECGFNKTKSIAEFIVLCKLNRGINIVHERHSVTPDVI